jgi:hypothetical protein
VVIPDDRAAAAICGLDACTCESTSPAVAISPSPGTIAVCESTTRSTPAWTSGFPARPVPTIRPSAIPIEVFRTPSTGSRTSTFGMIRSSALPRPAPLGPTPAAGPDVTSTPSRAVFPHPPISSSPG